jgi:ribosomal protein S18 acetylase RimI-like enzyme
MIEYRHEGGRKMNIRLADFDDLEKLVLMYGMAAEKLRSEGIYMWDESYPDKTSLGEDIRKEELFVVDDKSAPGGIAAAFVITQDILPEYANGDWKYPDAPYAVLHRLCVNVRCQHKGIGKAVVDYVEARAAADGKSVIKLDAHEKNLPSVNLYLHKNYNVVGEAVWRGEDYFLMEKKL